MNTPYNNQWVLGRSRWRRRGRAVLRDSLPPSAPAGEASQEPLAHNIGRRPQGSHEHLRRHRGFDLAFAGGIARKPPRWIDRDT